MSKTARILVLFDIVVLLGILALIIFIAASGQRTDDPPRPVLQTQFHIIQMTNAWVAKQITATAAARTAVATSPSNRPTVTPGTPDAVDAVAFCNDSRPLELIETLRNAVRNHDGQQFANLVSPHGLYMSLYPGGRAIHLTVDEVRSFFGDKTVRDWGTNGYSGSTIQMSLADGVATLLEEDLLPENANIACNDNQDGLSNQKVLYSIDLPDRCTECASYAVGNFYSVMRPGPPEYELEWGAWGLGFEYWQGQPTLIALTHYIGMP